jgi:hypothetical protein
MGPTAICMQGDATRACAAFVRLTDRGHAVLILLQGAEVVPEEIVNGAALAHESRASSRRSRQPAPRLAWLAPSA